MKSVDTIARVRRAFHVQGWSLKRISRELHVSRNTVRRILRSDETAFSYERERQPQPKIGPWQVHLDALLDSNDAKAKRERLTLIRIYEELRSLGYEGSYDAIRRYAKSRDKARGAATAEAYVPLFYPAGDAYQFDWSHEIVILNGVTVTVKVTHVRLCHSRMMFVRAYPLNAWLLDKCVAYARAHRHVDQPERTIWDVFEEERGKLVEYRGPFDGFHTVPASVTKTCTVRFDNNKYSVLSTAVGRPVEIHAYADRIVVRQDGMIVGEHARSFGRNQTVYDP